MFSKWYVLMSIWMSWSRLRLSFLMRLDRHPERVLVSKMLVAFRTVSSISSCDRLRSSENLTQLKMNSRTSLYTFGTIAEKGNCLGKEDSSREGLE